MNYVFDFKEATAYDAWFAEGRNRYCLDLELRLMTGLLEPKKGQRILDIGCGTGIGLEALVGLDLNLNLTGIDPSPYMLDIAAAKFQHRVDLHRGFAEGLPFDDNSFDSAFFFTSLEFMGRPAKAIEEACRVSRERVVICVLNRYAPWNLARRFRGFFVQSLYAHANFFSIRELKQMLFVILGSVPVKWRTTLQFPFLCSPLAARIENSRLVQRSCFGTLIGFMIQPVPKFRTRPMTLVVKNAKAYNPATGLATRMRP